MPSMHLDLNIKCLREKNKMSKTELGRVLGSKHTVIGRYESEESYPPIKKLVKICELFSVSFDDLLFKNLEIEGYIEVDYASIDEEQSVGYPYAATG